MTEAAVTTPYWQAYWALCKPKVVLLMLVTAAVGMLMAAPGWIPLPLFMAAMIGIGLVAGAGATFNHLLERDNDSRMKRTEKRPIPTGTVSPMHALIFALFLMTSGTLLLMLAVNTLTACLTLATMVGYAVIYTAILKPATPQNIVLGGLAGAMPPLLGWTAVTGQIDPPGLLLVLIIFTWTPPHFWALAIYRYEEYASTGIPMLPVTHGIAYTKLNILLYSALLFAVCLLPYVVGMSGLVYLSGSILLSGWFCKMAYTLWKSDNRQHAIDLFRFSIIYMFSLFIMLLVDHYLLVFLHGGLNGSEVF